ncbi:MAG: VapC toxin family PIN domain ribonuclease [Rhodocyclaceae bacterium]|nr:VapC toxin family PIN domain ribonuclease [Rhodocyclaceae bacterium]
MYLLDTNVVSELRRVRPNQAVVAWLESVAEADLHLCALSLGEIQAGIELTREQDADKAAQLKRWADQLATAYNILPMESATLYEDALIAACALVHKLTVVTRNVRDFAPFDVPVFNPFEQQR